MTAEEGIGAVTVSGGSPRQLIPFLRERGVKVLVVAPTVDSACKAESLGADAIVAEGSESGGVQGFGGPSTMVLVPAVVDAVKVPVIAAGGIGDSRGYRAAMEDSWINGKVDAGILPAGQISGLVKNILSVKEVIREMVG